jgi:hypothetical protein
MTVKRLMWLHLLFWQVRAWADEEPTGQGHRQIEHHGIVITGTPAFTTQVQSCLNLLAAQTPDDLTFIQQYMGAIKQHSKSGMLVWADPPRYEMSSKTAFYSLTWCANTIAHDAIHSRLYQKY